MQWALDTLTAYSGAFGFVAVFGTHLSSSQPCICHCDFGPDRGLLDVIQGQLDRCTAAGFAPAPARPSPETGWTAAWCWLLTGLVLGVIVGVLVGSYLALAVVGRLGWHGGGSRAISDRLETHPIVPGDCGLYIIDEEEEDWVSVERVPNRQLDEWLEKKRSGPGRDMWIHPIQRDSAGRRSALLKESVNMFKVPKFEDWPFDGPSAADEVLSEVAKAGLELHLYPTWWESKSGVNPQSSVAREVRLCFDYLRCFQSYDQLNLPALSGVELICRRVIVCQRAVKRNPKNPDSPGFERFLQASFDDSGGLRTSELDKYMAESQKTDATVLKQFRLWQEELEADKKRQAAKPGDRAALSRFQTGAGSPDERRFMVTNAVSALNGLDGFYQLRYLPLSDWFGIPIKITAGEAGISDVYDNVDGQDVWERVEPGERVWSCFCGVAMGWSWGLCICHSALTDGLIVAVGRMMVCSREVAERQLARDGFPAPCLSKGRPVIAPYVDNGGVVCYDVADAKQVYKEMVGELVSRGFTLRDLVEFDEDLDMVGFVLSGSDKCWKRRRSRFWRLYGGVGQLLARGGCAGDVMRVVLGHLVNFFLLSRCCLSILQECYQFVQQNIGRYRRFSATVVSELRACQGALPLAVARLSDPFYEKAFISDSSTHGHALHQGYFSGAELRSVGRWKERWRFADEEKALGLGLEANGPGLDADFDCLGESFDLDEVPRGSPLRPAAVGAAGALPRSVKPEVITGIVPALPDELLDGARWSRVLVGAWGRREAIHMKECRFSLAGLRHAVADPRAPGCQVLSAGDNLSEIMATEEGRAVDHGLNALCRRAAALQLGAEIRWVRRHVESERNPTDADSRLADKGVLKAGEALRPGRLAGRLRAAAASRAAAPAQTAEGKCPSRSRSERQTRRPSGILELFAGCGRLSGACAQDSNEVTRGQELALFSCRLLRACRQRGVMVSVENPASSGIWSYEPLKRELQKCSCSPVRYDACRYGAPFKKPTRFFTNAVSLGALERRCNCRVPHEILEGKVKVECPSGKPSLLSASRATTKLLTTAGLPAPGSTDRGSGEPKADALRSDRARARATRAGGSRKEGCLKSRLISAKTLRVHTEAAKLFYLFCKSVMMPTTTYQELDVAMEQYLHKLYFDGETISGPMYEQNLTWSKTSEFPLTRKALQGYRKSSCSVSRDGAPWECAIFLAGFMARHGTSESVQAAGLTLLMCDTYLRISEAISYVGSGPGPRSFYSLIVAPRELGKPTKAGAYDDTVLVGETAPERSPGNTFPDLTAQKYELIFRRACQALNFGDLKQCPHSLRHGGASVDALNGIDTLTIQKRGRWNVIASCRRYEKKGRILKQLSILGQARVQESADELAWLVSRLPQLLCSVLKDRKNSA
ncbi:unnamed protein product [Prorocentrum cordatum]|uniref:RNA-directed RNA polymerase n=1 Tax=Prorocentrum cordatum TaxID=2364126 RepID=A0ABN9XP94_9DINO|nr:unnamed protein product [Polarella glacialis]